MSTKPKKPGSKTLYSNVWFFLFGLLLPTQLGKHWWPASAFLDGVRSDYLAPTLYLTDLLLLAGSPLLIRLKPKLKFNLITVLLGLILIINFALVPAKLLFWFRLWQYFKIAVIILIFRRINKEQFGRFLQGLSFAVIYSLILAVFQVRNGASLQGWWYILGEREFSLATPGIATVSWYGQRVLRAYATFSHPNSLAGFFLIATWLFFFRQRWLAFVGSIGLVLLSFSKFTIILLGVSMFFWYWRERQACWLCKVSKLLLYSWLIGFSFLYLGNPDSLLSRWLSYQQYWQYVLSHPLGRGLGHYLITSLEPKLQPVHSLWLLLTIELGWVIWLFLFYWGKVLLSKINDRPVWWFVIVLLLLTASFDHYWLTLPQNMDLLGVVVGLIIAPLPIGQIHHSV